MLVWVVQLAFHGPLWTPDTMTYLTMSEALQSGTLRTGLHYRPIAEMYPVQTGWPPGYPALLAPLLALGFAPAVATTALSGVCFVSTVVLAGWLLQRLTQRPEAALGALSLLGFAPLLEIGLRGWSEGPWLVVWLGMLHALESQRSDLTGFLSGFLLLIRHASAPLLPVVVAFVAWQRGSREAAKCAAAQALVAGPWVLFSLLTTGRFGYVHPPDDGALSSVLFDTGSALAWSFAEPFVLLGPWTFLALLGFGFVGFRSTSEAHAPWWPWVLAGGLLQVGTYVAVRWGHYLDQPDHRLLLPLSMPLLLWGSLALVRHVRSLPKLGVAWLLWAGFLGAFTHLQGAKYFDWVVLARLDPAVSWLQANARPTDLVMHPSAVAIHHRTGLPVVGPYQPPYGAPLTVGELDHLTTLWSGRLLLFLPTKGTDDAALSQIVTTPRAEPIGREEGFTVWWVHPPP